MLMLILRNDADSDNGAHFDADFDNNNQGRVIGKLKWLLEVWPFVLGMFMLVLTVTLILMLILTLILTLPGESYWKVEMASRGG